MRRDQVNILTDCLYKLIESLSPRQYDEWMQYHEVHNSGVLDGITKLIYYIENDRFP